MNAGTQAPPRALAYTKIDERSRHGVKHGWIAALIGSGSEGVRGPPAAILRGSRSAHSPGWGCRCGRSASPAPSPRQARVRRGQRVSEAPVRAGRAPPARLRPHPDTAHAARRLLSARRDSRRSPSSARSRMRSVRPASALEAFAMPMTICSASSNEASVRTTPACWARSKSGSPAW